MQIRRERLPQMGATNYDKRSAEQKASLLNSKFSSTRLEFLSTHKGKEYFDSVEKKIRESSKDFKAETLGSTQTFYKSIGKKSKSHNIFAQSKPLLEPIERDKILPFAGDSPIVFDRFRPQVRASLGETKSKKEIARENLIEEKHEINTKAIQETQLIGMDPYTLETLKDKVDLQKVREIKRAIRRRYANQKKLYKIFKRWDADSTGLVSVKNVYNIVNSLGLKINFDEARVLVASADKRGAQNLTLDEFLDLIYNKDDVMNVNLGKMPVTLSSDLLMQKEDIENNNLLSYLAEDARKAREAKHQNQIKMILKNRLQDLNNHLYVQDPNHTGEVNYEKFNQCVRKLGVNENIVQEQDIKDLFEKHRINQHNTDYREVLRDLRDFRFEHDDVYQHHEESMKKKPQKSWFSSEQTILLPADKETPINIVDIRELPANTIAKFYDKNTRISRHLKRLFPTRKAFQDITSEVLGIENDKVANKAFSKTEIKKFFDSIFNKIDLNLTKRDFEGFFSTFLYNRHGLTNFNEIAYTIYDQDEKAFYDRVQKKIHGPAPPSELVEYTSEPRSENQRSSSQGFEGEDAQLRESSVGERVLTESNQFEKSPELSKKFYKTMKNGYNTGLTSVMLPSPDLNPILKRIEDRVFVGTKKAFNIYKSFDVDQDGFVSHKDMAEKLVEMDAINKDDIPKFLKYMDPESKGFVTYQEFHKRLRSNLTQTDEMGRSVVTSNMVPSHEIQLHNSSNLEYIRLKTEQLRSSFQPPQKPEDIVRATRHGANPPWKNTFLNFQADSNTALFLDDNERFSRDPMARTRFQKEEKAKKIMTDMARIDGIRTHANFYQQKVQDNENLQDLKDKNKRTAKLLMTQTYEHNAHLKNSLF